MTSLDMTESIAPRSDQLNADDLMTGPRTFTITKVTKGTDEQPFDFHLAEMPGRPFKPSKSMRRVMVMAWGKDAGAYAGKRLTLYRDPEIMFGRDKVGGIRIEAMSDLSKPLLVSLTVSKGRRQPYSVKPLVDAVAAPAPDVATDAQLKALGDALKAADITDPAARLAYASQVVGRELGSAKELTGAEASAVIKALAATKLGKEFDK